MTAQATKKCAHFCALVRHGERADLKQDYAQSIQNHWDPPLTKLGLSQAERTGEFFAAFCPSSDSSEAFNTTSTEDGLHLGFDRFIIETSPSIRCIQTANKIAEKLGVTKIKINYMASEFLSNLIFDEGCPLKHLEFTKLMKIKRKDRGPHLQKFQEDYCLSDSIEIAKTHRFK